MGETIADVDFSAAAMRKVDEIRLIPHQDVAQAAADVVRAAVEARRREIVVDVGRYNPNSGLYAYQDTATGAVYLPTDDGQYLTTITGQAVVGGDPTQIDPAQYQWILEAFVYFYERWPSTARALAEHCENAKQAIQSGRMTPIVGVSQTVGTNWGGTASGNFRDYFLVPLITKAVTNQQALLDELAVAMYAYEGLLRQARVVAMDVAAKTIEVLDGIRPDDVGLSADQVLGTVGVVLGIVTAVATGGTGVGISLGLIGAGLSAVSVVAAGAQISGETVDEVLQSLRTTLEQRRQEMDGMEAAIAAALEKTREKVADSLGGSPLDVGTVLPNEPDGDGVPNLTAGERPGAGTDGFHPRR